VNSSFARIQSELVINREGNWSAYDIVEPTLVERRVAIAGPYVKASPLRALCPPMTADPNGLLGSDFDTHRIIEDYG
jgi:hypothetical protein